MSEPVTVVIALGSNLGDRRGHLEWALQRLSEHVDGLRASAIIESEPVGVPDAQPDYLNAVALGSTHLPPTDLLIWLLGLERERGRERRGVRAARPLDLDLILYGSLVRADADPLVPHPRFRERLFVLDPLASLAPDLVDPVTGRTMRQLRDDAASGGDRQA